MGAWCTMCPPRLWPAKATPAEQFARGNWQSADVADGTTAKHDRGIDFGAEGPFDLRAHLHLVKVGSHEHVSGQNRRRAGGSASLTAHCPL